MTARRLLFLAAFAAVAALLQFLPVRANAPTVGLLQNDPGTSDSYVLFSPIRYNATYLIDRNGNEVHTWPATTAPLVNYLQSDGTLLRSNTLGPHARFNGGGATGRVERVAWDGTVPWQFDYTSNDYVIHHDIEEMPNGNVLMIVWEAKTSTEAIDAGRDPSLITGGEVQPDYIIEVEPTGPTTGDIVWEWHAWDHLVQDFDNTKANYGVVADHPELADVNYIEPSQPNTQKDWMHSNALDYNPALDQIMLSVRHFNEVWIIDHSTTTAEAAGHTGGNSGKGGDLLYRWGNPQTYDAGTESDRVFYLQHDTHWIEPGLPGAGNILLFNNGNGRPGGNASSADEFTPPTPDGNGNYPYTPGQPYAPSALAWTYMAPDPSTFYSAFISSAERQSNGNTLIDSGVVGLLFEVTPSGDSLWGYVNPVVSTGPLGQGEIVPSLGNLVFQAHAYAPDYPGLSGQDLTPSGPLEIVDSDSDGLLNLDEPKLYGTDVYDADTDDDGLADGQEVNGVASPKGPLGTFFPNPLLADTDGDSCTDAQELGADAGLGGLRDPTNVNDYFNPSLDGQNRVDDILLVLNQYFIDSGNPGYTPGTDRTLVGPHAWNLGPPDGIQRIDDVLNQLRQYFHDCA
jgi:hypothetical protein